MQVIIKNSAICKKCTDEVESLHRYDYKSCSCGSIAVDGGKDYLRRTAKDLNDIKETSIILEDNADCPKCTDGTLEFYGVDEPWQDQHLTCCKCNFSLPNQP